MSEAPMTFKDRDEQDRVTLYREIARLTRELSEARDAIVSLCRVLPDSVAFGECGTWAWNELDSDAQDSVKAVRDLPAVRAAVEEGK